MIATARNPFHFLMLSLPAIQRLLQEGMQLLAGYHADCESDAAAFRAELEASALVTLIASETPAPEWITLCLRDGPFLQRAYLLTERPGSEWQSSLIDEGAAVESLCAQWQRLLRKPVQSAAGSDSVQAVIA